VTKDHEGRSPRTSADAACATGRRIHRPAELRPLFTSGCEGESPLDGYVTGPNDSGENPFGDGAEMLHDWIFDAPTDEDRAIVQASSTTSARS